MAGKKLIMKKGWWLIPVLLLLVAINWAASNWHARVDLTDEKRFTLSEPTKKLLRKLDAPVKIDVLLKGDYPSGFRKLAEASKDILSECKEIAGNKLQFRFLSPDEQVEGSTSTYADTVNAMGFFPINLTSQVKAGQQQQFVYPVALLHYKDQTIPIELYKGKTPLISFQELNSAEAMLEYQFAKAINAVTRKEMPIVAYATGNGEPMGYNTYDLVENALKPNFRFFSFDLLNQPFIPEDFSALIMVKPSLSFTDEEKLKLDQYVMRGGKLLLFIDRLNAEMDSLQQKNEVVAYERDLKLNDLIFRYGARINPDLLMDLQCDYLPFDVNGNGQFELLPWNYFPVFESASNHPINKNLGFVSGQFVNTIDTTEAEGIRKTVLLRSSVNARKIGAPALISGRENVTAPESEKFRTANLIAGVLLEGKFNSFFANRLSKAMNDSLQAYDYGFIPKCVEDNKMVIVGDGDILLNAVIKGNQPIAMGMNPFTFGSQREFPFANREFLLNTLEYLVNNNGLAEAKSKDYVARLLDSKKVETEKIKWQIINIAVPVLLLICFALLFQWIRKRTYSKA